MRAAIRDGHEGVDLHVVEHSLQADHLHSIADAEDERALSRGMRASCIRLARPLNRALGRARPPFADRHHAHPLRSPREVRHALGYVLNDAKKHAGGRTMSGRAWAVVGALALAAAGCGGGTPPVAAPRSDVLPAETPLTLAGAPVRFLSRAEAARFLGEADGFTEALGDFDRSFRMRTTRRVDDAAFRALAAGEARELTAEQEAGWRAAIATLDARLSGLALPMPKELLVLATSGDEELGAGAYTRRNAIVFTAADDGASRPRVGLLAHELFHVLSRSSAAFRDRMYALVGFHPCRGVRIPPEIDATRLTDPDAHALTHCTEVARGEETRTLCPVLTLGASLTDALALPSWFGALDIALLPAEGDGAPPWRDEDGRFRASLAHNTDYGIHPEEMLADNFALFAKAVPRDALTDPDFMDHFEAALRAGR